MDKNRVAIAGVLAVARYLLDEATCADGRQKRNYAYSQYEDNHYFHITHYIEEADADWVIIMDQGQLLLRENQSIFLIEEDKFMNGVWSSRWYRKLPGSFKGGFPSFSLRFPLKQKNWWLPCVHSFRKRLLQLFPAYPF